MKFNANGGSVSASSTDVNYNSTISLPTSTRAGYVFDGWWTATSSGTQITNATKHTVGRTLYAHWKQNYTVTYNGNGNTSGSVPGSTTHASGSNVTVSGNSGSLAKTGYTFGGWNTKPNGTGTNYAAGSDSFDISENTTFYAKWTANSYNVEYNGNGSTGGSTGSSSHTYDTAKNLTAR